MGVYKVNGNILIGVGLLSENHRAFYSIEDVSSAINDYNNYDEALLTY